MFMLYKISSSSNPWLDQSFLLSTVCPQKVDYIIFSASFGRPLLARGEREWHLGVREREREWIIPFPKFGNGKGIEKTHSLNSGTGREWKKTIPKIREWEGNEKIYSQNSGTGREWKRSIPKVREREGTKKSIPILWKRESEAFVSGNGRERDSCSPLHIVMFESLQAAH